MARPNVYKYNYTFLFQSIAVYATTLALYLLIRGLIRKEFTEAFYDPVVYLLSLIIVLSALAVLYNVLMRRRVELTSSSIVLESALRKVEIAKSDIRGVKIRIEQPRGFMSPSQVITVFLKSRRRPLRIVPYNFERSEELFSAIKTWSGDLLHIRSKRKRPR